MTRAKIYRELAELFRQLAELEGKGAPRAARERRRRGAPTAPLPAAMEISEIDRERARTDLRRAGHLVTQRKR
ncbi:MAG: hypothetical protein IT372_07870 [Polyangiaceae bacterium]|nr:hypothetical protein [Polyangiaceae bacterium]